MCTIVKETEGTVPKGEYWLTLFDGRQAGIVSKVLEKLEVKTARYCYCLFRNGLGYIIRRKERSIPEQDQSWEDVAEIIPVENNK